MPPAPQKEQCPHRNFYPQLPKCGSPVSNVQIGKSVQTESGKWLHRTWCGKKWLHSKWPRDFFEIMNMF